MKYHLTVEDVRNDDIVNDCMETLMTSVESQQATNELIARIVRLANLQAWNVLGSVITPYVPSCPDCGRTKCLCDGGE